MWSWPSTGLAPVGLCEFECMVDLCVEGAVPLWLLIEEWRLCGDVAEFWPGEVVEA